MVNRRAFIKTSLVMSTLSLAETSLADVLSKEMEKTYPTLDHFLLDQRLSSHGSLVQSLSKQRLPLLSVNGDVTDLWTDTLAPAWKQAPGTVAGVTGADVQFVLETLARDHRMHLVHASPLPETLTLPGGDTLTFHHWILAPRSSAV